jgi:hypothetical protein
MKKQKQAGLDELTNLWLYTAKEIGTEFIIILVYKGLLWKVQCLILPFRILVSLNLF